MLLIDLVMKKNPEIASSLFGDNDVRTKEILSSKTKETWFGYVGRRFRESFNRFW